MKNNFSQLLFSMFYEKQKHLELKLDFWKQLLFSCTGCEALKMTEKLIDRSKQQLETTPTYIDTFWYSSRNFLQSRVSLNLQNLGWTKCFLFWFYVFFFSLVFNFLPPKGEPFYTMYDFLKTTLNYFYIFIFSKTSWVLCSDITNDWWVFSQAGSMTPKIIPQGSQSSIVIINKKI